MKRIAIVGGGPGGLLTARLLTEKLNVGIDITLFEAAPRLGGKVLTARFEKSGIGFEGGTAELYDYSMHGTDPLRELVNELGLKTMPFQGGVVALGDRILAAPTTSVASTGRRPSPRSAPSTASAPRFSIPGTTTRDRGTMRTPAWSPR
jgi:protoporphyrinogen oxidase